MLIPIHRERTRDAEQSDLIAWEAGLSLEWEGLVIGIRTNCFHRLHHLCLRLPHQAIASTQREVDLLLSFREASPNSQEPHFIYNGSEEVCRTSDLQLALDAFEQEFLRETRRHSRLHTYLSLPLWIRQEQGLLILNRALALSGRACNRTLSQSGWYPISCPAVSLEGNIDGISCLWVAVLEKSRQVGQRPWLPYDLAWELLPHAPAAEHQPDSAFLSLQALTEQARCIGIRARSARAALAHLKREMSDTN